MRNFRRKTLILALLFSLFTVFTAGASVSGYSFRTHPASDDIPNRIWNIYQAEDDYTWLCSTDGLTRIDNYSFHHYKFDVTDPTSLPGNITLQVLKDDAGNTWVMTDGGVAMWERNKDSFKRTEIRAVSAFSEKDACYFGAIDTIFKYDFATEKFSVAKAFDNTSGFQIDAILKWVEGRMILFSKQKGAYIFDPTSTSLTKVEALAGPSYALFVDSRYRIWRSVFGKGVDCLDQDFRLVWHFDTANSGLSNNVICCFAEMDNNIWMGTDGGGISIFDIDNQAFTVLKHKDEDFTSLPCNTVISLYANKAKLMLAGRAKDGVVVIGDTKIKSVNFLNNISGCYCPDGINSFFQGSDKENIWIATDGCGIMSMNLATGKFQKYPRTEGLKAVSIAEFPDGRFIFYAYPTGFFTFDRRSGSCTPFSFGDERVDVGNTNIMQEVSQGEKGNIYIHNKNHIYHYNVATKQISEMVLPVGTVDYGNILQGIGGQPGKYFHNRRYIFSPDLINHTMKVIYDAGEDMSINSISVDLGEKLWLATNKGLGVYNVWADSFELKENDFVTNVVAVVCDSHDRVWAASRNKLFMYNVSSGAFHRLDDLDGVHTEQFMSKQRLLVSSGDILIGGFTSMTQIDQNYAPFNYDTPSVTLESAFMDGKALTTPGQFNIPAKHKRLVLNVKAKVRPLFNPNIVFRFKLVGRNGEIVYTSDVPSLELISLNAGKYEVYASCASKIAKWSDWEKICTFRVNPYWYRSAWFIIFVIIMLLVAGHFIATSIKKDKNRKLAFDALRSQHKSDKLHLDYLANVSHELRTPLALMMGPLERLIKKVPQGSDEYTLLSNIHRHGERMGNLLNTTMRLDNLNHPTTLDFNPIRINKLIEKLLEDFNEELESRKVTINKDLDETIGVVDLDEMRTETVLANLVMNALNHSPEQSAVMVRTESLNDGQFVRISVADRGPGIKEEDFQKLFSRSYSESQEIADYSLGLTYARNIAHAMGGQIEAFNNPGGGSTFCITIPVQQEKEMADILPFDAIDEIDNLDTPRKPASQTPAKPVEPDINAIPASVLSKDGESGEPIGNVVIEGTQQDDSDAPAPINNIADATLLFVEDDLDLRNYLLSEFSQDVKRVLVAGNGIEAIKVLHTEKVDVVVSDIMMPEMDGYALCRYIKTTLMISHLPVILLTARSDENSRMLGYKNGADDYITKPFDLKQLQQSISNLFLSRELMRQRFSSAETSTPVAQEATFSSADEIFMKKFDKIINENISNPDLDVKYIVDSFATSRTVLYNKVKQLTGMNIQNYINKCRMDNVITLMKTTDMSLAEIAEKSGFGSPRYFSTSFKNYTGMTPSQYKKEKVGE